jgi:membrane protein
MASESRTIFGLVKTTGVHWLDDKAPRLAASLAFYTLLSLAPMLVVAVSIAGLIFGEDAARGQIAGQLNGLLGPTGADTVQSILAHAKTPSSGIIGAIVGIALAIFGASGVFGELQTSLDSIWHVESRPGRGIKGFLRDRVFSFTLVMGVAFLLLVSLVVSAALSAIGAYFAHVLPGGEAVWHILNLVISIGITAVLFGLIFKVVPDVEIRWHDVWLGALVTAILFTGGKFLIGLYLGRSSVASPFGAAGSVVALVVWIYYSAQILFFGAELTRAHTEQRGIHVVPSPNAVPVTPAQIAVAG